MKDIVEKLDKYAHGHEKSDFEKFDNIYKQVISGELILELSDIVKLCGIFNKEFDHIEPHQYCDIQEMTIVTMNNYDLNRCVEGEPRIIFADRSIFYDREITVYEEGRRTKKELSYEIINQYAVQISDRFSMFLKMIINEDIEDIEEFVDEL